MIHLQVSLIELAWLMIVSPGLVFSFLCWRDARRDKKAVQIRGFNGVAKLTTDSAVVTEGIRMTKLILLTILGVSAAFRPPQPAGSGLAYQIFAQALLIVFAILLTANTAQVYFTRKRILDMLGYDLKSPHDESGEIQHVEHSESEHILDPE